MRGIKRLLTSGHESPSLSKLFGEPDVGCNTKKGSACFPDSSVQGKPFSHPSIAGMRKQEKTDTDMWKIDSSKSLNKVFQQELHSLHNLGEVERLHSLVRGELQ